MSETKTKINLDQPLKDFDGKPLKAGEPIYQRHPQSGDIMVDVKTGEPVILTEAKDLTLHQVLMRAVRAVLPEDEKMEDAKALMVYTLGHKMVLGGEVSLTAEEVVLLKSRVKPMYGITVRMQVNELLDPNSVAAESKVS